MKKQQLISFQKELIDACERVGAKPVQLILGSIGLLIFYFQRIELTINPSILLMVSSVLLIIIVILYSTARKAYSKSMVGLPKVIHQFKTPPRYPEYPKSIGLVLEPSNLYAIDTVVSIYFKEEHHEALIGVGFIENIQENGFIQIIAFPDDTYLESIWNRVCQNDSLACEKISVKPSVPKRFIRSDYL